MNMLLATLILAGSIGPASSNTEKTIKEFRIAAIYLEHEAIKGNTSSDSKKAKQKKSTTPAVQPKKQQERRRRRRRTINTQ